MALIRDEMEPLAREIAHFLVLTGATAGSRWYYHGGYKRGEDLIPHKQSKNDEVWYSREKEWGAQIRLYGILEQAPDPDSIVVHPEIVLTRGTGPAPPSQSTILTWLSRLRRIRFIRNSRTANLRPARCRRRSKTRRGRWRRRRQR